MTIKGTRAAAWEEHIGPGIDSLMTMIHLLVEALARASLMHST